MIQKKSLGQNYKTEINLYYKYINLLSMTSTLYATESQNYFSNIINNILKVIDF